ncbi:MAG TPA: hydroxymethylbilane synthase [Myxococcales bacterium]|nr:hydroxymethylbilane synthase [Myxococcales bacterium]HIK84273.1 hydroxymethylbilane synthase [Myxococcales bacterium]
MKPLRIATRGSDLALYQARRIAALIEQELQCETELVVLRTTGDRIQDRSLAKIGGKGLFVKEIEEALLDGRADVAVHSAKDIPAKIAEGCVLAAYPERVDPRDALASRVRGTKLQDLAPGAKVGTGSTRRTALLRSIRPDLEIVPLRGNVPTRLGRLEEGELDAVMLACAGLDRLGLSSAIDDRISADLMLPAIGQGLLALETRADDEWRERIHGLESFEVGLVARAERAYQRALGGDCSIPLAGFAERLPEGGVRFRGLVASLDGSTIARAELVAADSESEALGERVAAAVLNAGGREILESLAKETAAGV